MKLPSLGHVGLSVSNMRRSLEFYRDILLSRLRQRRGGQIWGLGDTKRLQMMSDLLVDSGARSADQAQALPGC